MIRSEALELLISSKVTERRLAARYMASQAMPQDVPQIRRQLLEEKDLWVRRTLGNALRRLGDSGGMLQAHPDTSLENSFSSDDIRARAISETTNTLMHELAPIVGAISRAAESEVPDYGSSRTRSAIEHLNRYFDGIRRLGTVAGVPKIIELDLTDLVTNIISDLQTNTKPIEIMLTRDEPLNVFGDYAFLEFAIRNGLKNALEASEAGQRVLVNIGVTDKEAWVNILDEGEGLPGGLTPLWIPGRTTKSKAENIGMGLPIARQALKSLGGTADLRPRKDRGMEFELKWPQQR